MVRMGAFESILLKIQKIELFFVQINLGLVKF